MEGIWECLLQRNCVFLVGACDLPSIWSGSSSDSAASLRSEWAIIGVDQSQPRNTWAQQDSRRSHGAYQWNTCNCVQVIYMMSYSQYSLLAERLLNEEWKLLGRRLVVVALSGDQKDNPPWGHLLYSPDTLPEQNLLDSHLVLLSQFEMPEVMVMIWFCELWHKLRVSVSLRRWLRFSNREVSLRTFSSS